mmetsp:Transcript_54284/g.176443  ORF Transcript_54284/g.176443 Transcript_54284/m.176443 type:complete len:320 (+) Transcript_54284:5766-6725(+)
MLDPAARRAPISILHVAVVAVLAGADAQAVAAKGVAEVAAVRRARDAHPPGLDGAVRRATVGAHGALVVARLVAGTPAVSTDRAAHAGARADPGAPESGFDRTLHRAAVACQNVAIVALLTAFNLRISALHEGADIGACGVASAARISGLHHAHLRAAIRDVVVAVVATLPILPSAVAACALARRRAAHVVHEGIHLRLAFVWHVFGEVQDEGVGGDDRARAQLHEISVQVSVEDQVARVRALVGAGPERGRKKGPAVDAHPREAARHAQAAPLADQERPRADEELVQRGGLGGVALGQAPVQVPHSVDKKAHVRAKSW